MRANRLFRRSELNLYLHAKYQLHVLLPSNWPTYRKHQQVRTTQQTNYGLDGTVSILGGDGRLSSTIQPFIQTGPRVHPAGKKRRRCDTYHSVPSTVKIRSFTGAPLHVLNDTFIRIYEIYETEDNDSSFYTLHREHGLLPLEGPTCESCTC